MSFTKYWAGQFREPRGFGGRIACFIMNRLNQEMYKAVFNEVKSGKLLLDIGFGNGYLLKKLSKLSDLKIYGIDISEDMVKVASKKNQKAITKGKLRLERASVESIGFEEKFDKIYTINTIYFWDDLKQGLSEICGKLESGGEFLNACYTKKFLNKLKYTNYGFAKYETKELLDIFAGVGFEAELIDIKKGKSYYIKARKRA
ncbi:MAG: class I SAM-dependent methyltransferase [Firmicutes bacterium]|nr:class I SAM-dependent methyltransferase [Bacillota bacterium]